MIYGVSSQSGTETHVKLYDLTIHESFNLNSTIIHSPECDLCNFIEWKFWYSNITILGEE